MLGLVVVWVVQGLQWQAALLRVRLHALLVRLLLVLPRMLWLHLWLLLLMSPAAWLAAGMLLAVLLGGVNILKPQTLLFLLDRVRIHDLRRVLLLLLHVFLLLLVVLVLRLLHLHLRRVFLVRIVQLLWWLVDAAAAALGLAAGRKVVRAEGKLSVCGLA